MSLKIKRRPVSNIPPLDGGTYMGVCIAVLDLGEQYKQYDKQKQGKYVHECMFVFEVPGERVQVDGEDKPRWLSTKRLAQSLHERSALYQMLTSWRGKAISDKELDPQGEGFDITQMLGQGAMLTVTAEEKDDGSRSNRIQSVSGYPKGIPVPAVESELLVFDADDPDAEVLEKLPEWIQDIIRKSTQFAENPPAEKVEFAADAELSGAADKQPHTESDAEGDCPI